MVSSAPFFVPVRFDSRFASCYKQYETIIRGPACAFTEKREEFFTMQYRKMGNTGVEVSALGFGCMRMPVLEGQPDNCIDEARAIGMIRHAIDSGVNYIDTAYFYHHEASEPLVGKALRDGYREKVNLATKMPVYAVEKEEDFDFFLNNQLERLQTDHIDFYLMHALSLDSWKNKVLKFDLLTKAQKARAEGKVRYLGFSFHDNEAAFQEILNGFDGWDFCQIQMNYIDVENQATLRGLEAAHKKGLGVVIMEPLLGGKLANLSPQVKNTLDSSRTPVEWALDFLWNRPEVSVVLSGMGSEEMVEQNLEYASRSSIGMLGQAQLEMLANTRSVYQKMALVPCTGCAYCMPCPFGLDIPGIYEIYNQTVNDTRAVTVQKYASLAKQADACRACRKCEGICPQHIESSTLMPVIHEKISAMKAELEKK